MLRDTELHSAIINSQAEWEAYKARFSCGNQCHEPEAPKSFPVLAISLRLETEDSRSWPNNLAKHTFITPKALKAFLKAA